MYQDQFCMYQATGELSCKANSMHKGGVDDYEDFSVLQKNKSNSAFRRDHFVNDSYEDFSVLQKNKSNSAFRRDHFVNDSYEDFSVLQKNKSNSAFRRN